jgi:hypothetical protein
MNKLLFIFAFLSLFAPAAYAQVSCTCEAGIYENTASGGDFSVGGDLSVADDLTVVDDASIGGKLSVDEYIIGDETNPLELGGDGTPNRVSTSDDVYFKAECEFDDVAYFDNGFYSYGNVYLNDGTSLSSLNNGDIVIDSNVTGKTKLLDTVEFYESAGVKYGTIVHDGSNFSFTTSAGNIVFNNAATFLNTLNTYNIVTTGGYQHLFGGSTQTTASNIFANNNSDEFFITVDANQGRQLIITDSDNYNKDHDHATPTDPTVFIHSATDPDTNNTQWISLSHNKTDGVIAVGTGDLVVPSYTRHIDIPAGAATLGPTSPTVTSIGVWRPACLDADAEQLFIDFEVPDDWIGTSDMTLKIYWFAWGGGSDAIADTEKVKLDANYLSVDFDASTELYNQGSTVEATATYTQSGAASGDGMAIETELTLDYDNATQPLVKGDVVGIVINRDVTGEAGDAYSGDACIDRFEISMQSNKLPEH